MHEDGNTEHINSKIVFYIGYPLRNCSASFFEVYYLKKCVDVAVYFILDVFAKLW